MKKMDKKLKMSTGTVVELVILLLILLVHDVIIIGAFFGNPETWEFTFDLMGSGLLLFVIGILLLVFVEIYVCIWIYNSTVKALTFNKDSFTFKGRTYTYHQIEKIKLRSKNHFSVYYMIYVDDKRLYIFDDKYEGAKEFLYYLDFYKVPGTPRG